MPQDVPKQFSKNTSGLLQNGTIISFISSVWGISWKITCSWNIFFCFIYLFLWLIYQFILLYIKTFFLLCHGSSVVVLDRMKLIFFVKSCVMLCFGFLMKMVLIAHQCFCLLQSSAYTETRTFLLLLLTCQKGAWGWGVSQSSWHKLTKGVIKAWQ